MTTTTTALTAHALCDHPVTKAARAKCRKIRGAAWANAAAARATKPKIVIEPCICTGKPAGFHDRGDGVWVCVDCDRPSKGFAENVMNATAA